MPLLPHTTRISFWSNTSVNAPTAVVSPPRTKPLVAMAEVERPVMVVTTVAIRMMAMVSPIAQTQKIDERQV